MRKKELESAVNSAYEQMKIENSGAKTIKLKIIDEPFDEKTVKKPDEIIPFKKPNSDYMRLELIVRKQVMGKNNHPVLTEEITTNYKQYLDTVRGRESYARYIQRLLDEDMKKHKYEV